MAAIFADLLRRLRLEAGLSQEALAKRADISLNAVSYYERGLRSALRKETIAALVGALELRDEARAVFERAASRKRVTTRPRAHNLPWQPTSFVGRQREIEQISALIAPRRLVTVTGAGGIGKTRTVLEVASRIATHPRDGAWFIDLAPVNDGTLMMGKIVSVLGLQMADRPDLLAAAIAAVKRRQMLIILDNCEHVIDAVRKFGSAVLRDCPDISLVATSRESFGIAGEVLYQLSSLPVPGAHVTTLAEGRSYGALELFSARAAAAKHDYFLSDEDVETASAICRRLDGIPLAIELAAATLPRLGLSGLRVQLAAHFGAIDGGRHDLPARQQTLHATIAWSYDLLCEPERILFRRLGMFVSGWTLEAAEHICADDLLDKTTVLTMLVSLAQKSLVVVDIDRGITRYSFFESTRVYALEQLAIAKEEAELSRSHALWMATFSDRAYDTHGFAMRSQWEGELNPELDNALAALEWSLGPNGDVIVAGRIASGFRTFWQTAGLGIAGRRYVNSALERIDANEHPLLVARLLLSQHRFLRGTAVIEAMRRAISLVEPSNDKRTLARCYGPLAYTLAQTGKNSEAEDASDKQAELIREVGLQRSSFYAGHLGERSSMFLFQGRFGEAKALVAEALNLFRDLEDDWGITYCLSTVAEIEFCLGDTERAVVLGKESLASARRVRGTHQEVYSLCNLACFHLVLGELDAARASARAGLKIGRDSNANLCAVASMIQHLAAVSALRGHPRRAARLLGHLDAWYKHVGNYQRDFTEQRSYDILLESLRNQLSDDELATLSAEGAQFTEDGAIAEALAI